jgi:hypothetical protein
VQRHVELLGFGSLADWAGVENLEERLDPSGESIDPKVLEVLREKTAG